jgi:NAD(P)-dependent dehydrogenase (short-subunit alcohol dehydrogenase family)
MSIHSGQVVLIANSGSIAGQAIALNLAKSGMKVSMVCPQLELIEPIAGQIQLTGGEALALQGNIEVEEDVKRCVAETIAAFGQVDVLIIIATVWGGGMIHNHPTDTWDRIIAANLRGPFLISKHVLNIMRGEGNGKIIFTNSESGLNTYAGDGVYGVTAHALDALAAAIRVENQGKNIRVDVLHTELIVSEEAPDGLHPSDVASQVATMINSPE